MPSCDASARLPESVQVRIFRNRGVGGQEFEPVFLRGGDEEPVERVPVNGRQQGGARGNRPADRDFMQPVPVATV